MGGVFHEAAASLGLKEASAIGNMQSVRAGYWYHWLPMYLWLKSTGVWFWIIQCFLAFRGEPLGKFCKSFRKWRRNSSLIQLIWDWLRESKAAAWASCQWCRGHTKGGSMWQQWMEFHKLSMMFNPSLPVWYSDIHFYWIGLWMDCKFAFSSQLVQPTAANRLLDIFKTQGLL